MDLTLAQLEYLAAPEAQELLAMELSDEPLRAVQVLRRHCGADEAHAIITLRALRHRAAASGRFPPELAQAMLTTDTLLQQATSLRLALWKGRSLARRLGGRAGSEVWDLCCGLGGDAIGLARAGFAVRGVDDSPAAVLCAAHNARIAGAGERCRFERGDVETLAVPHDAVIHIDPDRRPTGRRTIDLAEFSPNATVLARLIARSPAGAVKLPGGADALELDALGADEFEYVSEEGVCKQLVAWWQHDSRHGEGPIRRRATVVAGPAEDPCETTIAAGLARYAPIGEPGPWLIEPDVALIAAEAVDDLAAAEGLWRIAPGLPWLFGDRPVQTPLATCFEVLAQVPGRARDIARAVRKFDGGLVEIKPRGLKLDTDVLQRQLRGEGSQTLSVLWCRRGAGQQAFLCRRLPAEPNALP